MPAQMQAQEEKTSGDYLSKISFSKLRQLYECPRKWEQRYILNNPPENDISDEFKRGQEMHNLIEYCIKNKSYDDLIEINENLAREIEKLVRESDEISTEFEINCKLSNVEIEGRVDVLSITKDSVRIFEIKPLILYHKMKFTDIDKYTRIQLLLYAYVISQYYPELEKIEVGIISYISQVALVSFSISASDLEKFEKSLKKELSFAHSTLEDYFRYGFETRPSWWCGFCQYKRSCPTTYKIDDFKEVARELRVLEEKVAELRKIIREYTKQYGAIQLEDYEYGWFEKVENSVDAKNLLQYFINEGIDFKEYFKPDLRKIISLAKKDDEVANFVFSEIVYEFKGRKIKKEGNTDDNSSNSNV